MHEGSQVVHQDEARSRVGKGRLQKDMVGAQEGEPVQRAAGEIVGHFGAELGREEGVFGGEGWEVGEGHCEKDPGLCVFLKRIRYL